METTLPTEPVLSDNNARLRLPPILALFEATNKQFNTNLWVYVLIGLVPIVAQMLLAYFVSYSYLLALPLWLIFMVLFFWSQASLLFAIVNEDKKLSFKDAFAGGSSFLLSYIWISILVFVVLLLSGFVFLVPALIFGIWFYFWQFTLMVENKRGPLALFKSREYVRGYWWPILGRTILMGLLIAAIAILISILTGIISVFLGKAVGYILGNLPALFGGIYSPVFFFQLYKQLKAVQSPERLEKDIKRSRLTIIITMMIGVIVVILGGLLILLPHLR